MKNELNVFKYDYLPWKRPFNWPKNIKQFFKNFKYAWQRATKGYSDRDVWNLDVYYSELFYNTLTHLAETSHSYPGVKPWENEDDWYNYLTEMAYLFRSCIKEADERYPDEFDYDNNAAEEVEKRFELSDIVANQQVKEKNLAFDMLKKSFFQLWD